MEDQFLNANQSGRGRMMFYQKRLSWLKVTLICALLMSSSITLGRKSNAAHHHSLMMEGQILAFNDPGTAGALAQERAKTARKITAYSDLPLEEERARLNSYALRLKRNPSASGYIIAYEGRKGRARAAQARADRARDYLINSGNGIDASRILVNICGEREEVTLELWLVPSGAAPPDCRGR